MRPCYLKGISQTLKEMLIRPPILLRIVVFILGLLLLCRYIHPGQQPLNPTQDGHQTMPPEIDYSIPETIHQLLISMPGHPVSRFRPNEHTISWLQSGWKLEYWNEDACLQLAQELDATSLYAKAFKQLPTAVLRSDFCRYLIMFGRGGIYNDLDVHLVKPLPWNVMGRSKAEDEGPPALIIGLEGDASTKGLPRSPQLCSGL